MLPPDKLFARYLHEGTLLVIEWRTERTSIQVTEENKALCQQLFELINK